MAGLSLLLGLANIQTVIALGLGMVAVILILVHHALWPVIQRPLESLDRHKVLTRRRGWWFLLAALLALWSFGVEVDWLKIVGLG